MRKSFCFSLVLAIWGCINLGLNAETNATAKPLAPQPYYGEIAKKVMRVLPSMHLLQYPVDEALSRRAWTNFVSSFDPDHSYFLQEDIREFSSSETNLAIVVKSGDVTFAYQVHERFLKRLDERYAFVTNQLAKGFSFAEHEMYVWKRKDEPWPATVEEQNELWRKRVKNELLVTIIGREMDKAAASNKQATATKALDMSMTNAVSGKMNGHGAGAVTNLVESPEVIIGRRYKQYVTIFQDMDEEMVLQRCLSSLAMSYDPHSDYMSPMRKEDFDIDMNLSLCGIGAVLRSEDGMVKIMEIMPGGPAGRDMRDIHLLAGDKIIGVGQGNGAIEDVMHMPLTKTVRKIRGKKGTKVVLRVIPVADPSGTTTKLVDLIRDDIKLEEQAATSRVVRVTSKLGTKMSLGVVKLPAFYGTMDKRPGQDGFRSATVDIAHILARLNTESVSGLILDLRTNGGGSLREAITLTGLFVRSGPAVQVREINQVAALAVPNADPTIAFRKPMIVLINRASASASEIVAGALQDYGRAVIVGDTQSHGKGTVQTVMPLGNEKYGSIKLTTASFYRINGASTQIKGVSSDIVIPSLLEGLDIGEDKLPGALPWSQIDAASYIPVSDMAKFVPELRRKSAERLATNQRYTKYCALVRHVKELSERKDVPLEMVARRKQMEAEKEIRKIEEDDMAEEETGKPKKAKEDDNVVFEEATNILVDLIDTVGSGDLPLETEGDLRVRMMRIFGMAP
ncbi:MAG: carboxy terminal-processing peptidase [bacterium]